ncbi:bifunctional oligoribonuclease/PAP phosphatase NrnA [Candidatus Falkowbacteria bacterium]|nr:bifunctional oligoribonuclease/PAP phosphatase NrnA [Candidatus Falkowbacteria bacterium]
MNSQLEHKNIKGFELIKKSNNILLVTHHNPDGDGISSMCAMMGWLASTGKMVTSYCYDKPPEMLSYLPCTKKIQYGPAETTALKNFELFDLIIILDCGSISRTKISHLLLNRGSNQKIIEIDHHPKIDDYADLEIREPSAAATAELIYAFFKTNKVDIDRNLANELLTGIMTDTANFFYPSTSTNTINIAADLVLRGGRLPQITENTWRNKSLDGLKLWGEIMSNLQINPKYDIAFTVLTSTARQSGAISKDELDGISGFLSNLYGVKGVLFLQEELDGKIRGNLRTNHPKIDISRLARFLGGGGHPKASGFSIKGKLSLTEKGWRVV